ncbi:hypothetical protein MRB53_021394 [Persea americana]|uniref:Uncharacterized protein n=1 Tax=Persea americana TaxID=3435 RepID=A0ACC2L3Z6_PERAE|nr:hypothetical protein MRB53_021394 [Persea americana]
MAIPSHPILRALGWAISFPLAFLFLPSWLLPSFCRISSLSLTPWFQPQKEKLCAQFPRSPRGSLPLFAVSLSAGKALSPWDLHLLWLGSVQ